MTEFQKYKGYLAAWRANNLIFQRAYYLYGRNNQFPFAGGKLIVFDYGISKKIKGNKKEDTFSSRKSYRINACKEEKLMQDQIRAQTEYVKRLAENLYKLLNQKIWIKIVLGMVLGIARAF